MRKRRRRWRRARLLKRYFEGHKMAEDGYTITLSTADTGQDWTGQLVLQPLQQELRVVNTSWDITAKHWPTLHLSNQQQQTFSLNLWQVRDTTLLLSKIKYNINMFVVFKCSPSFLFIVAVSEILTVFQSQLFDTHSLQPGALRRVSCVIFCFNLLFWPVLSIGDLQSIEKPMTLVQEIPVNVGIEWETKLWLHLTNRGEKKAVSCGTHRVLVFQNHSLTACKPMWTTCVHSTGQNLTYL